MENSLPSVMDSRLFLLFIVLCHKFFGIGPHFRIGRINSFPLSFRIHLRIILDASDIFIDFCHRLHAGLRSFQRCRDGCPLLPFVLCVAVAPFIIHFHVFGQLIESFYINRILSILPGKTANERIFIPISCWFGRTAATSYRIDRLIECIRTHTPQGAKPSAEEVVDGNRRKAHILPCELAHQFSQFRCRRRILLFRWQLR